MSRSLPPLSRTSLTAALTEWCSSPTAAEATHGHISRWDTSQITDLSSIPSSAPCHFTFNEDINGWDVAQVTSMKYMFWDACAYNKPLNAWNLSKAYALLP